MKYFKIPQILQNDYGILVVLVAVWRIGLFFLAFIADRILKYAPSFPYATSLLPQFNVSRVLYSFANFDGVHYLTIAREGYFTTNFIQAFFPLYPYLIRIPSQLFPSYFNPLIVGLLLSTVAFLFCVLLLYTWVRDQFGRSIAFKSVLALLLFPSTIFFGSVYTESVFLLLVIGSFFAASKHKWGLASFLALLASATRIVGIFLLPALLLELWTSQNYGKLTVTTIQQFLGKEKKTIGLLMCAGAGLLAYMGFLHHFFNDALYFLHVQSEFGAGRSEHIVLYPQVVYRYIKIFLTVPFDLKYIAYLQEFIAGTLGLLILVRMHRKVSRGVLLFSLCAFLLPTLSGTFSSMLRYLLVCPPVFIAVALCMNKLKRFELAAWVGLGLLAAGNAILFFQGYWVA